MSGELMNIGRKIAMSVVVTVAFFILLEGVLAVVGVEPESFAADPYVGFSGTAPLFVDDGSGLLSTAENKLTLFNAQTFARDKGDSVRIFCVGGSTTFGRPYDDATSFCGWLRELLPVADPSRRWEVINAGGVSYASYRVALLMEELIDYRPDLFVIYSGHNEFLERRSYPQIIAMPRAVRGLGGLASKTRIWTAMSRAIGSVAGSPSAPESNPDILDEEVTTLLDGAVGPTAYTRDDELSAKVMQHFRFNIARMVEIARSAGAEAVLVTPAANLADSRPFKSEHRADLSADELARFEAHVERARVARSEGRMDEAVTEIARAAAIDPRHAQLAFLQGKLLAEAGRWEEARAAYERARDEDVCPLRALGPTAGIVREVAVDRGAPLVDFDRLADEWSPHGIPGANLFLDHVHPTIEVHRRLALAIIDVLAERGLLRLDAGWGPTAVQRVAERVEGAIDQQTHALALMKLSKVLGWAGKHDESLRLALQAVELWPEDSRIQYNAGLTCHLAGRKAEAVKHYRRAIAIQPDADEPHGNLGVLLEEAGFVDEAIVHFREAIRYARSPQTAQRNTANLARALTESGYRAYAGGRFEEALAKLSEAAGLASTDPEILSRLGIAQVATGRPSDAVGSFERALAVRPDDPALLNRLAVALALDGRVGEAAATYRRALTLDDGVADYPDNVFAVLGRLGRGDLVAQLRRELGE